MKTKPKKPLIRFMEVNNNGERIIGLRVLADEKDKVGKPYHHIDPDKAAEAYKNHPRFKHPF